MRASPFKLMGAAISVAAMTIAGSQPPPASYVLPQRIEYERKLAAKKDGYGRRRRAKVHPNHNSRRRSMSRAKFAVRVRATHSFNDDPRADKYLHSVARQRRFVRGAQQ